MAGSIHGFFFLSSQIPPAEAVQAYEIELETGEPSQRRRAGYLAGVLAQDKLANHNPAEALFESYLSIDADNISSDVDGMIRLARSKIALGKQAEAIKILSRVIAETNDNAARKRAQRLLGNLYWALANSRRRNAGIADEGRPDPAV